VADEKPEVDGMAGDGAYSFDELLAATLGSLLTRLSGNDSGE